MHSDYQELKIQENQNRPSTLNRSLFSKLVIFKAVNSQGEATQLVKFRASDKKSRNTKSQPHPKPTREDKANKPNCPLPNH